MDERTLRDFLFTFTYNIGDGWMDKDFIAILYTSIMNILLFIPFISGDGWIDLLMFFTFN